MLPIYSQIVISYFNVFMICFDRIYIRLCISKYFKIFQRVRCPFACVEVFNMAALTNTPIVFYAVSVITTAMQHSAQVLS